MKKVRMMLLLALFGMSHAASGQMLNDVKGQNVDADGTKKVDVSLGMGVNAGWMTSRVYTPVGDYTWKGGAGYFGELNCVFAKGLGFGVDYEHSETGYPVGYGNDSKLKLDFLLPYFLYSGQVDDKWLLRAMVGIGYSHYQDADRGQGGFGLKTAMAVEYLLNRHLGLALELERRTSSFSEPEEFSSYKKYKNESFGYSRLAVNLGLMVHL